MAKPSYYELLKHPKWQEKRLRIMDRDNFQCTECGDKGNTLNVHHGYYRRGAEPWDYEDETLHTLCQACHLKAEELRADVYRKIAELTQGQVFELRKVIPNGARTPHELGTLHVTDVLERAEQVRRANAFDGDKWELPKFDPFKPAALEKYSIDDLSPRELELLGLFCLYPHLAPLAIFQIAPVSLQSQAAGRMFMACKSAFYKAKPLTPSFQEILSEIDDVRLKTLWVAIDERFSLMDKKACLPPEERMTLIIKLFRNGKFTSQEKMERLQAAFT